MIMEKYVKKYQLLDTIKKVISRYISLLILGLLFYSCGHETPCKSADLLKSKLVLVESFIQQKGFQQQKKYSDSLVNKYVMLINNFVEDENIVPVILCNLEGEGIQPDELKEIMNISLFNTIAKFNARYRQGLKHARPLDLKSFLVKEFKTESCIRQCTEQNKKEYKQLKSGQRIFLSLPASSLNGRMSSISLICPSRFEDKDFEAELRLEVTVLEKLKTNDSKQSLLKLQIQSVTPSPASILAMPIEIGDTFLFDMSNTHKLRY